MMTNYLAYDIKGIQQFIFSVPKLKYIVGASLLIDKFDQWAKGCWHNEVIFTGGGRGIFHSENENKINEIRFALVEKAEDYGLDLRLGVAGSFSEVVHCADDLYAFVPNLDGEPDAVSGMLPTICEDRTHPIIEKRREEADTWKKDSLDNKILDKIWNDLPKEINSRDRQSINFLSNVDSQEHEGKLGSKSLGNRNRWAIVCLDGNDMGSQFRAFEKQHKDDSEQQKNEWYREMSKQLDCCTKNAFYKALTKMIKDWYHENSCTISPDDNFLVLPFRPLILGGDDVTVIIHSSCALEFAKTLIETFNKLSKKKDEEYQKHHQNQHLWVGTNGELTISAGIAYTNVSLPLHTSIPYAEKLLGSAKGKFRKDKKDKKDGEVTPAAIDWEHITESMLDTPTARRNRDLVFYDEDIKDINTKIILTERPYKIEDITKLEVLKQKLRKIPSGLLAECQTILKLSWAKRIQRLAAIKKQNNEIFEMLKEKDFDGKIGSTWTEHNGERYTTFLDAVSLLEEEHRLTQTTTEDN
ncbi:MAG: hypothetical protein LBG58_08705 [Planctomycetaceae bacterium]|jgi:hypothetical protein|nr:hypothetical protein [Planctomycetaceae bacterium]